MFCHGLVQEPYKLSPLALDFLLWAEEYVVGVRLATVSFEVFSLCRIGSQWKPLDLANLLLGRRLPIAFCIVLPVLWNLRREATVKRSKRPPPKDQRGRHLAKITNVAVTESETGRILERLIRTTHLKYE